MDYLDLFRGHCGVTGCSVLAVAVTHFSRQIADWNNEIHRLKTNIIVPICDLSVFEIQTALNNRKYDNQNNNRNQHEEYDQSHSKGVDSKSQQSKSDYFGNRVQTLNTLLVIQTVSSSTDTTHKLMENEDMTLAMM